ncbi:MAG: C-GCAxxG-C-C family (seleno)protein [bacterium]
MSEKAISQSTRRKLLKDTTVLVSGGLLGGAAATYSTQPAAKTETVGAEPPPLPWEWPTNIDPLEAGRQAYQNYFKGGCGHGAYSALLGLLQEKVGYPWTTMPKRMMVHAAAGYGGHGTLCGALGGTSLLLNLLVYKDGDKTFQQMVDRLYHWYSNQEFPTNKFDDISKIPNQIKVQAGTPLCHTSVTRWMHAANASVTSQEKLERCAKVTGEIVYVTTKALNEYFAGEWTPPTAWKPSDEIRHCVACHSPDDTFHTSTSRDSQQGRMECVLCHDDHTK